MEVNNGDITNQNTHSEEENDIIRIIRRVMARDVDHLLFRDQRSSPSPFNYWEYSIFDVPEPLRNVNPKAYTPRLLSIGPLHFLKFDNPMIAAKKCGYVVNFLSLARLSWDDIIVKVLTWKERACSYYSTRWWTIVDIDDCFQADRTFNESKKFVQVLILDGCFVVMFMIGCVFPEFRDIDTQFFWRYKDEILKDMLLLENQLPFFLLHDLYDLLASTQPSLKKFSFIQLVYDYFYTSLAWMSYVKRTIVHMDSKKVNHLVDFLRIVLASRPSSSSHILDILSTSPSLYSTWPPTATELHNCGVSFKNNSSNFPGICMMDMHFQKRGGVLNMPQIVIDDSLEISLRNIIAYEYGFLKNKDVSNFAMFLHLLINTDKDVSLLIDNGIIQNHLGSTNEVTRLFRDLCKHIVVETNIYSSQCREMKEYCMHRRHRWMAILKNDYFSTPWALISFIAAVVLLLLTLLQAVVAVIALYKT